MAETKGGERQDKTIEMRLAEIEDKLAQMHVTDEEMKAFAKVSNLMGAGGGAQFTPDPNNCGNCSQVCVLPRQISRFINRGIIPRIPRFVCECNECQCGPCGGGFGGGFGGGGFGSFGS